MRSKIQPSERISKEISEILDTGYEGEGGVYESLRREAGFKEAI